MWCLVRCSQNFQTRTNPQKLASKTRYCKNLLSTFSSFGGHRGFCNTAWSQEEINVECLPNNKTPWLMMNPTTDNATGDTIERFYSPAKDQWVRLNRWKCLKILNSAHCIGSTVGGWLSYVEPENYSVLLTNPYTNHTVELPSLATLPSVVHVHRHPLRGDIISVLRNSGSYFGEQAVEHWVSSMALSWSDPWDPDAVVTSIQTDGNRLVYCPIGKAFDQSGADDDSDNRSEAWLGLQEDFDPGHSFEQTVYSKKSNLFYSLFRKAGIQAYDLQKDRNRRSKLVCDFPQEHLNEALKKAAEKCEDAKSIDFEDSHHCGNRKDYYLVPLHDTEDLLLLVKHYRQNCASSSRFKPGISDYYTTLFDIFRVDLDRKELERVDSLGDRSIFVGLNQSFDVSAGDSGLRPNSIYFTGREHGIFDVKDRRVLHVGYEQQEQEPCSKQNPQVHLGYLGGQEQEPCSKEKSQLWVAPHFV